MTDQVPSLVLHRLEAQAIHRALLGGDPAPLVLERFLDASRTLNARCDEGELTRYYEIIEAAPDLESLEIACRYANTLPLLSLKFRLMVYLAETLPENQHVFVNFEPCRIAAWWTLIAGATRTTWKLLHGRYLLARFHLA